MIVLSAVRRRSPSAGSGQAHARGFVKSEAALGTVRPPEAASLSAIAEQVVGPASGRGQIWRRGSHQRDGRLPRDDTRTHAPEAHLQLARIHRGEPLPPPDWRAGLDHVPLPPAVFLHQRARPTVVQASAQARHAETFRSNDHEALAGLVEGSRQVGRPRSGHRDAWRKLSAPLWPMCRRFGASVRRISKSLGTGVRIFVSKLPSRSQAA